MSDVSFPREGFLSFIGLHQLEDILPDKEGHIQLAEADIDPRTGGAVAVKSALQFDSKGNVAHIKTYYWYIQPNGRQQMQELFDVELEVTSAQTSADAELVSQAGQKFVPKAVYVLGRKIYHADDDLLLDTTGHKAAQGMLQNVSRVFAAIGAMHRQMRDGKLPEIAKILKEKRIHDVTGDGLTITGLSPEGGFNFLASDKSNKPNPASLKVPLWVAQALSGIGANALDAHQRLTPKVSTLENDTRTGHNFLYDCNVSDDAAALNIKASIAAYTAAESGMLSVPNLMDVHWSEVQQNSDAAASDDRDRMVCLEKLNLLDNDMAQESHLSRMQALGVVHQEMRALRRREYPATLDHLVANQMEDRVYDFDAPPPLAQGGRLSMISLGGNNMEEIARGFGTTIGGNCKVVYHEGLDEKGRRDRVGVIVDLGLHLDPKDSMNLSAAPDVIKHLKDCRDILITHRHLDHTDGLFIYMQAGYLKHKTLHATPEVIRFIREKARNNGIAPHNLPAFHPLEGEGWLHIKDRQHQMRLSVNFARNATPHTARTTPFFIHGHYKGKWIGSYLNHGDARFGRHNAEGYAGPEVDADHLNKAFFTNSNQRLLKEVPGLDPSIATRGPTYFDIDTTSIQKAGWGPTELEIEDNLTMLSYCFADKGVLLGMISTNENRLETAARVATRSHRDLTAFGTNLEKSATAANVLGVNDLRVAPKGRKNIQEYLDWYYETRLRNKIKLQKEQYESEQNDSLRTKLFKKMERNEHRLDAFLSAIKNKSPNKRYEAREELEMQLRKEIGGRESFLGSIHVGRISGTARKIMEHSWRRLVLLTGTQNTNAEVDAALVALSEGRHSSLNGNPQNNPNARPVDPSKDVIIISQTAIPGNEAKQADMVRKLCTRGYTVMQSIHDGVHIHHVDAEHKAILIEECERRGKTVSIQEDGSLVVAGFPIHAGGHGHAKDCEAWVKMVGADVTAAQHTSPTESVRRLGAMCAEHGLRAMDRVVPNFEAISIRAGESPEQTEIKSIGRQAASMISIKTVRQNRKYHGGYMEGTQIIRAEVDGGFRQDGLRAGEHSGGYYERAFAHRDREAVARETEARRGEKSTPHPVNTMAPPDHRPERGARTPQPFRVHPFADRLRGAHAGFGR